MKIDASTELLTFHNVSINTRKDAGTYYAKISFTFHNVSINTPDGADEELPFN